MTEFIRAIRTAIAAPSTRRLEQRYFGQPMRPTEGLLADHFVTLYRSGRDPETQELLARRHEAYVDCLRLAGLRVPETNLRLLDDAGTLRPVIVQRAVREDQMAAHMFQTADTDGALAVLDRLACEVTLFWQRIAQRPERIGLHACIERFAIDEGGALFLDTFPPLISYSRDEIGLLIRRFADNGLVRGLGKVLPGRIRDMQDRWYCPAGSLETLIDGAVQLRPQDSAAIRDWAEGFNAKTRDGRTRDLVPSFVSRHANRRFGLARPKARPASGRDRPHA